MNDRFLRACRREPVDRTPIWLMRQAGRALPEYRALKEGRSLLEITRAPELAAQITLQPVQRLGVDAAILYADIMSPLVAIGVELDIVEGKGPVMRQPFTGSENLVALRPLEPEADVPHVIETIRILRRELASIGPGERASTGHDGERASTGRPYATGTPLIGFAGAPFTLASYLVEGHATRDFTRTKSLMYSSPALWHALMDRLATIVIGYGRAQIEAGVQAFQLFDSWIGALSPREYVDYIQPHVARIFGELGTSPPIPLSPRGEGEPEADADAGAAAIRTPARAGGLGGRMLLGADSSASPPSVTPRVPLIHFGTGTQKLLEPMAAAGGDVFGLDWRTPLDEGWARVGGPERVAIQGNLNPHLLLKPWDEVRAAAEDVLRRAAGRRGHIFNLGHGILPMTPVETLERLVAFVHEHAPDNTAAHA